jgi:transcriptional regulator with XRE-family HTH domain
MRVDDVYIGNLIYGLRHKRGFTQERLAEAAKISVRALRAIESGEVRHPRHATITQLALALDVEEREHQQLHETAQPPRRHSTMDVSEAL